MRTFLLTSFLLSVYWPAIAQGDFSTIYRETDPAIDSTNPETKFRLHKEFLEEAYTRNDSFAIILGNLYLSNDYMIQSEYSEAMPLLIEAGNYAEAMQDTLLLGRVNHKKGAIFFNLKNNEYAITAFKTALRQSELAKDTLFIAISLEQLARLYAREDSFSKSNAYYRKAIPMIEECCRYNTLTTTLINYGSSLDEQDSVEKAIQIYKRSIQISERFQDDYETIPAKQNLALVYARIDSLDKALALYQACRLANKQHGWLNFLIYSYDGLAWTYEKLGQFDSAYFYAQQYQWLKDSVIGTEVQSRINDLEMANEMQKKDIAILEERERASHQQQQKRTILLSALMLLGVTGIGLWLLFQKVRRTKLRFEENKQSLQKLTNILASKNAELRDLKSQSIPTNSEQKPEKVDLYQEVNLYDLSILTDDDWHTFKNLFDRAYPKYLVKIRQAFPAISEAEERMFVFIKLRLSNKESANIIGVQPETIKKTRSRLKKRLGLGKDDDLDEFVMKFG